MPHTARDPQGRPTVVDLVPAEPRGPYRPAFLTDLDLTAVEAAFVLWIAGDVRFSDRG